MRNRQGKDDPNQSAKILAWISALIHAWATGNTKAETEARNSLSKMGVALILPDRRMGVSDAS